MSNLFRSTASLLREAAYNDGAFDQESDDDFDIETAFDDIEDLDTDFDYDEEMIPVIADESAGVPRYFVEYVFLQKLMESKNVGPGKAMEILAEYNGFPKGSSFVILDKLTDSDKDQFRNLSDDDSKKVEKQVKDLKDSGIGILMKDCCTK